MIQRGGRVGDADSRFGLHGPQPLHLGAQPGFAMVIARYPQHELPSVTRNDAIGCIVVVAKVLQLGGGDAISRQRNPCQWLQLGKRGSIVYGRKNDGAVQVWEGGCHVDTGKTPVASTA